MKVIIFFFIFIVIIIYEWKFLVLGFDVLMDSRPREIINSKFPKIVHLMYFPWNKNGKLKENELDFDKVFYNSFKENNSDWEVKLWTLTETKKFVETNYPKYSNIFDLIKHPVQTVDFFRLLVTYHYGGIYWQYGSKQKVSLNTFIPPLNKKARLFVEVIIPNLFSQYRTFEKLRDGKPEELIRVSFAIFSCFPKNKFLKYTIDKVWNNLNTMEIKSQYDILYVGGNAMFSEAYHEYPNKQDIHLTMNTYKYISFSSKGSWRLNSYN
jgi:mannosyltransferase OCH1-like enzyme